MPIIGGVGGGLGGGALGCSENSEWLEQSVECSVYGQCSEVKDSAF